MTRTTLIQGLESQLSESIQNLSTTEEKLKEALEDNEELRLDREDADDQLQEMNFFGPSVFRALPAGFANRILKWIEQNPDEVAKHRETMDRLKVETKAEKSKGPSK